jgi:hypothetical protein
MTRTRKYKPSTMTIPQLRKAFDHIESYTLSLLHREKDRKKCRKAFQDEWMKTFHRSVNDKAADAYIQFESTKAKKGKKTRRHQKGGAALSGAPLDYSTRPGIYVNSQAIPGNPGSSSYGVYGQFPDYISGGFTTMGNATNKMAIQEGCNSAAEAAKFQAPYTGFGAASLAQKGGKSRKGSKGRKGTRKHKGGAFPSISEFASAASFRPMTSSNPPGMIYSNIMDFKGSAPYASSFANTDAPPYQPHKPLVIASNPGVITRDLTTEI